jgi:DNA-binding transcriptional LysR family regulator
LLINSDYDKIDSNMETIKKHEDGIVMKTSQLEYLASIVDKGSFAEAAFEHNITQSAISKQISALEDEIGVQLFARIKRKAVVTPAGEAFLAFARNTIKEYHLVRKKMLTYADRRETSVTVGMHCLATHYDTWLKISEFQEKYPQFLFEIKHLPNWDILDSLNTHNCNFGILYDKTIDHSKYCFLPLATDKLVLAVSKKHPLANRKSISIEELRNEKLAFTKERTQMRQIGLTACREAGFEPIIHCFNSFPEPILSVLRIQNVGLLFLKKALCYYSLDGIKIIPLKEEYPIHLALVYPRNARLTIAEKCFINLHKKTSAQFDPEMARFTRKCRSH